jgi:hypothetical protein
VTVWNWITLATIWLVVFDFWAGWFHVVKRHPVTDCQCTRIDGGPDEWAAECEEFGCHDPGDTRR